MGTNQAFPNDVRRMISDALGNLVRRMRAVNVLIFAVQDVTEAVRQQVRGRKEVHVFKINL